VSISVLNISLDSQIAWGAGTDRAVLGDPAERQRAYAAGLVALHIVVKTGPDVQDDRVSLARNAWAYPTRSRSRYSFLVDAYRIGARLCRTEPIDVVSAQDPFATGLVGYLLSRRFGKPLNVQVHFDVLDNPHWIAERQEHRLLNHIGKWLLRRASTVRVGTTREAEQFVSIPRNRIFVAPVPVDLEHFRRATSDERRRMNDEGRRETDDSPRRAHNAAGPIVLNASRLVPQKDLSSLLRAAKVVLSARPDAQFLIAGDGPLREPLQAEARQLGIGARVRFLGRVDHAAMPELMASADLLVVSSLYEGTSLVTVQAAAAARPVVTTDVAGAADTVIDGETGHVVPIGDSPALARAILDVLADPGQAKQMGAAGRVHVSERFNQERSVRRVIEMWERTAMPRTDSWLYLANVRVPSEKAHVYQIFQMLEAFAQSGVDVTLVYPKRANLPALPEVDPVQLYGLRAKPALQPLVTLDPVRLVTIDLPALNRPPIPQLAFAVQSATFALSCGWHARASGVELLYSRDWPMLLAAGVAAPRASLVWEAHDLPLRRLSRAALRRLLPRLAGIVAISNGLRDELVDWGVNTGRILVAPDAVNLDRFSSVPDRTQVRSLLGIQENARLVVYTGHLYRWKGAHTLALASRCLPEDVQVCVVGGTPADLRDFRSFVDREHLEGVRIAGHVPPGEVPLWLAAADVLALPNSATEAISARYTSPLKLYEYMAASRPIVASDLPSLREVLRHGQNAWLVRPDAPGALAEGIRHLLSEPELAHQLAAQARRDVAGCTWDARAAQIVAFVEQLMRARAGGK
jgi:glycosyltransferase involved in cell wall biosynthesis